MALDQTLVANLQASIANLVSRIATSSGLSEAAVLALITGRIAGDATASAGVSTTDLASIRGAYLAAEKMLGDELGGNPAGLQTLLDIANAIVAAQDDISDVEAFIAGLANVFNYVGTVAGGASSGAAFDLATLPVGGKDAGDYYKVTTSGWFRVGAGSPFQAELNDGLVWNTTGGVDVIDNTVGVVNGTANQITVSGSAETGFTVALAAAFLARVTALEGVVTSLNTFGVLSPVTYSAVVTGVTRTAINATAVGTYNVAGTATQFGVPSTVLAAGSTPVVGQAKVVDVGSGNKQIHLSVVVEGRALFKTIKGDVADGTVPTNAAVVGWTDDQADINQLMVELTDIFDAQLS